MSTYYSNITLAGPTLDQAVAFLKAGGHVAYVAAGERGKLVIFHEDLGAQEQLARDLSAEWSCPALLAMAYGQRVLLYQLYEAGEQTNAYVSSPHDELEDLDEPAPPGDAAALCRAFDRERMTARVETILRKPSIEGHAYAYAMNRHGELLAALALPLFAVGASYASIELGEMPSAPGFDPTRLVKGA